MADLKALIEHIATRHWEYGQGGVWDRPADAQDAPFPAYATPHEKAQYRAYATQLLGGAPILADALRQAEQEDALRELLSYCRTESTSADLSEGEQLAYDDVVIKLAAILDGAS